MTIEYAYLSNNSVIHITLGKIDMDTYYERDGIKYTKKDACIKCEELQREELTTIQEQIQHARNYSGEHIKLLRQALNLETQIRSRKNRNSWMNRFGFIQVKVA